MDFAESAEQTMLRTAVAKLAAEFGHRYHVEKARKGEKTDELWRAMADNGYLGVNIPAEYGGGGMGITELAIVEEELSAAGCPLLLLLVSPAIAGTVIDRFGSEDQKKRWLPGLASGDRKIAFAITEPDAGSNSHRISTTAKKDGDIWRLNGTKYFTSGVDESDDVLVVAKTSDTGLSLFVVDPNAPGLRCDLIPVELVQPEKQFTLFFDNVEVPGANLVGAEGDGLRQIFAGLNPERIMGAALSVGLGRYALAMASAYARDRKVWDVPIGAHQGLAHPLAEAKIDVELARLMMQKAAWLYDNGEEAGEASNMAKLAAADASLAAIDQAIQVHGGLGFASETGLADIWGLARTLRTAPVSREMILNFVAQHSLGLPKSY